MRTIKEVEERITVHQNYAAKMLRIIRTNPNLGLASTIGLSNALNQIEELEWVIGKKHNYEAILKLEHDNDDI